MKWLRYKPVVKSKKDIQNFNEHQWELLQEAVDKEINVWQKYGAIEVIPPEKAKHVPKHQQLDSKCVWTNKSDNPDVELIAKCRIVGKGFQETYDPKLRRDSPTCSPFAQHLVCAVCADEGLDLYGADIKNAYVQGRKLNGNSTSTYS